MTPTPQAGDPVRALEALEKHFTLPRGDNDTRLQMLGYIAMVKQAVPPSPMVWTTEKPTRPGFYWYYCDAWGKPGITEVFPAFDRLLMYEGDGSAIDLVAARWAGPIPEPLPSLPRKEGE
jgi:hypothetical protein